jgi:hypothetical protein
MLCAGHEVPVGSIYLINTAFEVPFRVLFSVDVVTIGCHRNATNKDMSTPREERHIRVLWVTLPATCLSSCPHAGIHCQMAFTALSLSLSLSLWICLKSDGRFPINFKVCLGLKLLKKKKKDFKMCDLKKKISFKNIIKRLTKSQFDF